MPQPVVLNLQRTWYWLSTLSWSRSSIIRLKVREVRGMNQRLSHYSLCCATKNIAVYLYCLLWFSNEKLIQFKANVNFYQPPSVLVFWVFIFLFSNLYYLYLCTFILLRFEIQKEKVIFYCVVLSQCIWSKWTESQHSSMHSGVQSLRPLWKSGNKKLGINSLKVLGLCEDLE